MRIRPRRLAIAAAAVVAAAAIPTALAVTNASAAADPTAGFHQYQSGYKLQNWTNRPNSAVFSNAGGVISINVHAGERRVEMAWDRWIDQHGEHEWSGDVLIDRGSTRTAIMQVKNNGVGEAIYIQIYAPDGSIREDGGQTLAKGLAGQWFHMNCAFDPATGIGRIWINGNLVMTKHYRAGVFSGWYFKNGAYNNGLPAGGVTSVHFRNLTLWTRTR
jgi:hypothetical protein